MADSREPILLIVGTDLIGPEFKSKIASIMLASDLANDPNYSLQQIQGIINEIFQESLMQIFDCMTTDFQDFSLKLMAGPDFNRFISGGFFFRQPFLQNQFREAYLEYGTGIFFAMKEQNVIFHDKVYIVDNPGIDHFTCMLYPV